MVLSNIEQVRFLVQDNSPGLYIITDDEINFLLQRNSNNVNRASLEAAKVILLNLSMRGDETVDIFSLKGSKSASEYRASLMFFLRNPDMNPALQNAQGYFGGVSKSDMEANDGNLDNNLVPTSSPRSTPNDYFSV